MTTHRAELTWEKGDIPGEMLFKSTVAQNHESYIIDKVTKLIPEAVNDDNIKIFSLFPYDNIVGRYQVVTATGPLFVRISSRLGNYDLERGILDHLDAAGIKVNRIINSSIINWHGETYRLDVRPFLLGRHYNKSDQDILGLASHIKLLHQSLKKFKNHTSVKFLASQRYSRLKVIKENLQKAILSDSFDIFKEHCSWAQRNKDWLANMAHNFTPDYQNDPAAQCLHGEIHPGNLIFIDHEPLPFFLDFEESVHIYAPPTWDLAYAFQRFCLRDIPPAETIYHRHSLFKKGYGRGLPQLTDMMKQIAWFSIATILEMRTSYNIVTPLSELDKFLQLERQAAALDGRI